MAFGTIGIAVLLFLVPAIPSWHGDPDRDLIADLTVPISIFLLVVYVVTTFISLRRHSEMHDADAGRRGGLDAARRRSLSWARRRSSPRSSQRCSWLARGFAEKVGLSDFFVSAVIVAIVGNAAEHGGAVVVAHRGKVKLAAEIALASAAQVAVFLIPVVALLSWLIDPLALGFRQVEILALAGGLVVTATDAMGREGLEGPWRGTRRGLRPRRRSCSTRRATATARSESTSHAVAALAAAAR